MADKLDLILKELQDVKTKLKDVKSWQHQTDVRLDRIERKQEQHEKMITQLLEIVGATNGRVVKQENQMNTLKAVVDELVTKSNQVVESVNVVAKRLEKQNELIELLTARSLQQEQKIQELQQSKSA